MTALLFGAFGLLSFLNPFFGFYFAVAAVALMASAVCFILGLIKTMFFPLSLLSLRLPGDGAISSVKWLNAVFCRFPHFRISVLALCASITLFWVHKWVFPVGITIFLVATEMLVARFMFR
jgi:hypothetical protein